jgi:hypothetical protein
VDYDYGDWVELTQHVPLTTLRRGMRGVVIAVFENTLWVEFIDAPPTERVTSVLKQLVVRTASMENQ